MLIHCVVSCVETEVVPFLEIDLVTLHLHITGVGTHLELVHLVGVNSLVGECKVLVVRFAHVDNALVVSIDEVDGRLVCLSIDVDARTLDDFLHGRVDETGTCVVASVANLQDLVTEMLLLFEWLECEVVEMFIELLSRLELEGMRCKGTAPSTARTHVCFL